MATILITGTNRGLGLEFTRQYAGRGDHVIATARNAARATDLQALASASGGHVEVHDVDVADKASMDALKRDLGNRPVDILINNAGVLSRDDSFQIDYDAWHRSLLVNTLAPVYMTSLFLDNVRAGTGRKIVTLTSHMGSFGQGGSGILSYRASKAGVNRAMYGFAEQARRDGISVGLFHPGWVRTDMGGASAAISPKQSVAGLISQIDKLNPGNSGRYLNYNGSEIPW